MKTDWFVGFVAILCGCSGNRATRTRAESSASSIEPIATVIDAGELGDTATVVPTRCSDPARRRVCLAAGVAQMGRSESSARFDERPARGARLAAFDLDADEVSASEYLRCVSTGQCHEPHCDDGPTVRVDGPARCIAWNDARDYCRFVGGRLPSEAEWERAAAGLLPTHRTYPWGTDPNGDSDITPEGVRSMGGSVAEWVDDVGAFYLLPPRRDAGIYDAATDASADVIATADATVQAASSAPPLDTTERELGNASTESIADSGLIVLDDPRGPAEGPWRIARGGHETLAHAEWTTTRRWFRQPTDRRSAIGFRCAYTP